MVRDPGPDFLRAYVKSRIPWLETKAEAEISGGYPERHQILSGESVVARAEAALWEAALWGNSAWAELSAEDPQKWHLPHTWHSWYPSLRDSPITIPILLG